MRTKTLALVGATGGAGTTRTAVELAALGARDGRDVAVVDAAFTTQGLSEYVSGRIGTDLTTLVTDETGASLSAATYPIVGGGGDAERAETDAPDLPGRADAIPARAPFERVARAKTAEAARKLERRIDEAATSYDAVIVDVAPVGSNEAVAGVTAADRTAAVFPATTHGRDALQRLRGRVADVGAGVNRSIAVVRDGDGESAEGGDEADADVHLPPTASAVADAPTASIGDGAYARAVADAFEAAFDATVGIEFAEPGLVDRLAP
ncbi:cell division inhibitor [Halorubrum persicum]|uniref:Cell division inhibitor n=1 Tax=Halorubrum persicum TaxID=1383844 RepID=A0A2G1WHI0_9EURY|nr:AAA family ATPase [Halorubrum persicum]PHQ38405.1 cell division inhibitor [Halorubrum persicum]